MADCLIAMCIASEAFCLCHQLVSVSCHRDFVDNSITIENKRRDYMVMVGNVLLVGGEDKADRKDLKVRHLVSLVLACLCQDV